MSRVKRYTPGPWYAFARLNTQTFAVFGPENDPRKPVVEWPGFDATITELGAKQVEANAHLIASAPELLEALEEALNAMIGCSVPAGGIDDRQAIISAQKSARAAIAKARGETS